MRPGTLVLLASPLDPPSWWAAPVATLESESWAVIDPTAGVPLRPAAHAPAHSTPSAAPHQPPIATHWIAQTASRLHASRPANRLAIVAHGAAGPLVPALARTQRAARRAVVGYVFVDATLPRPGPLSHLDLLRAADPQAADDLHATLHAASGRPGRADSATIAADHHFWAERLPSVADWPDAPCGYLRTVGRTLSAGPTAWWARSAAARGWLVDDAIDPDPAPHLGDRIARLLDQLV